MTRAAIYARYSTDRQREASIDDQVRVARAAAKRLGVAVVAVHSDSMTSGSVPVAARAGGKALLADALAGRFEVLLVEGLDRLSRDIGEQERVVKRLEHRGVRIVGVSDGYDSASSGRKVHRIARGLVNELYLDDLRAKTHRGLAGLAARGLNAGGLPYGYRSVDTGDGHRLEIDEARAAWVRYVYERYADGWSPQRIAHELNRRQAPSPRGGTWAVSALYGHPQYQTGILRNPIYTGRYMWNRSQWLRDPDSERRRRVERPKSEWCTMDLPELAIVPAVLWQAVQARLGGRVHQIRGQPPRTALAGLLRCGHCGGAVVAVDARAYGCAARKDRGPTVCPGVRIPRVVLEQRLLDLARDDLLSPAAETELRRQVAAIQAERADQSGAGQRAAKARLAALEREIAHLVEAVAAAGWSQALRDRLQAAEAERSTLRGQLDAPKPADPATLIPRLLERYRAMVADLPTTIQRDPAAARAALRETFGQVELTTRDGEVWAEVPEFGALLNLVAGACYQIKKRRWRVA